MSDIIIPVAEVKSVRSRKTSSNDREIEIRFICDDDTALALAAIPGDQTVRLTVST